MTSHAQAGPSLGGLGVSVEHVVDAGADEFMRKPFTVSELRSRATALLA